ncbi:MAG TPA: ABC transporter permease [Dehalococcoidia bacterium]|nr:ABC transporter permease [Dehalococcoidia bacterium]
MFKRNEEKQYRGMTRWGRILRNLGMILPVIVLTLLIVTAIFADVLAPYPYDETSLPERRMPPAWVEGGSSKHFLGTDTLGRDILSRAIYGARVSLSVSLLAIAITAIIGTALGIFSAYMGGRIDAFVMRVVDVALSFPPLLLAILIAVSLGPGYFTVVFALSALGWAGYARVIRGESLRVRNSDFVAQAVINGVPAWRIMLRHIFPNTLNVLIIGITLNVGTFILAESGMSYLGIGIPPPMPSWGSMVADGRNDLDRAWWISTFPGILIGMVVMSGNFLGDWLRDKLDPRLRQL